ncbi:putative uncharacterized protein [Ruminococcus sp. CAG:579]|nr:putative uncharacterized protein [Ruminococcus sp. CAG:579]
MRSKKRYRNLLSGAAGMLLSALAGFSLVFLGLLLFSFIMTRIDVSEPVLSVLTSLALCVGAYVGGYTASRRRRRNGLLMGVCCGLFMFLVIFALSYFFAGTAGGFSASAKLIMTLVCAGTGGVIGVNSAGRRFRL